MRKWPSWLLHSSSRCVFSRLVGKYYLKETSFIVDIGKRLQHQGIFSFHIFITQHLQKMSYMSNLWGQTLHQMRPWERVHRVESQKLMGWIFYPHPELLIPLKLLYHDIRRWTGCWKLAFFTLNFGCVTTDAQNDRPGEGDSFQNYGHFLVSNLNFWGRNPQ